VLRAEKATVIDDLNAVFKNAGVIVVTQYRGLSVPEVTQLRTEVRSAGAGFKVTKNRLAKRALDGTPFASLAELFTGPTAIAFSADPVAASKVITAFAKRNDKLQIVGGGLAGAVLDAAAVRQLAELPSLDELRARLIALLQTPASRLVGLLQAPGGQLARCLKARSEQAGDEPQGRGGMD
jgi:large subunit ribosomal protein L10